MPKVVDHEQRREELAAALWRLVLREGIEAASVRRVAAEAGWSTGSLRHYFETQSELLAFAMELVVQRVSERVAALPRDAAPRALAERALHEVLPLDDERRAEMQVWLAFTARSLVEPGLRELRDRAHAGLRSLCRAAADLLAAPDPERQAERLHALIDGLALHAVLDPATTSPARQVELLAAQLDALSPRGTPARAGTAGSPPPGSPSGPAP
jgi:AcrR family transcriptional regulator